jgi:DHA1 family bicyclomycin/chloramphenicol resistance-like MFS transporter
MSNSYFSLLSGRLLQAFGASMIPGTGRAMIRDHCNDLQVVSLMGWLAVLGSVMFVGAPTLGGILTTTFGWRSNFSFLSIFSCIVVFLIFFYLPETLSKKLRTNISLKDSVKNYLKMLMVPRFSLVILPLFLAFIFQGAYLGSASFIFIKEFHFSPENFGYINVILLIGLLLGRNIAVKNSKKNSAKKAFWIGAILAPVASLSFIALIFSHQFQIILLLLGLLLFSTSIGIIIPLSMKVSISAFSVRRGETASLQAFVALFGSAVGALLVSLSMHFISNSAVINIFASISIALACLLPFSVKLGIKYIK